MRRHIVLCGDRQVGKSTLVNKLLRDRKVPLYGFITKAVMNPVTGVNAVHMFRADDPLPLPSPENHLADCDSVHRFSVSAGFETLGVRLLKEVRNDGIVILDELGFLEERAPVFCDLVLRLLDGDIPVLAVAKTGFTDIAFLNAVRNHPRAERVTVDRNNRDSLCQQLKPVIREWQEELLCRHR